MSVIVWLSVTAGRSSISSNAIRISHAEAVATVVKKRKSLLTTVLKNFSNLSFLSSAIYSDLQVQKLNKGSFERWFKQRRTYGQLLVERRNWFNNRGIKRVGRLARSVVTRKQWRGNWTSQTQVLCWWLIGIIGNHSTMELIEAVWRVMIAISLRFK